MVVVSVRGEVVLMLMMRGCCCKRARAKNQNKLTSKLCVTTVGYCANGN